MKAKLVIVCAAVAAFVVPTGVAGAAAPSGAAAKAPGVAAKAPGVAAATGEVKLKGRVSLITPTSITVRNRFRTVTYRRGARPSLRGIRGGTFVEGEGRRVGGVLRLTSIHRED